MTPLATIVPDILDVNSADIKRVDNGWVVLVRGTKEQMSGSEVALRDHLVSHGQTYVARNVKELFEILEKKMRWRDGAV